MSILNHKFQKNLAQLRRDIAPHMIPWWNNRAEQLGYPLIPDDWVSWPGVSSKPEEGFRNKKCFWNAQYANIEMDAPVVVGIHFGRKDVLRMLKDLDPNRLPYSHAVNLNRRGEIVDFTWGHGQMVGLMVGRAFTICHSMNLKTYCAQHGFVS